MKISAKIDYACRALLELALHWPNDVPLQLGVIARRQGVPIKFLTQIFIALKQSGYAHSIRGKSGGYLLAKAPRLICLREVVQSLGGVEESIARYSRDGSQGGVMDLIWGEINDVVIQSMDQLNFEMIAQRQRKNSKVMMFEI